MIVKREKTQHFTCFYIRILSQGASNCKTKSKTLFYDENS